MARSEVAVRGALLLALLLTGCQSMVDVKPGDGRTLTVTDRSYAAIWQAALTVADEHFEIHQQDQARGVIVAERTMIPFRSPGSWVGIYITPPTAGAAVYTVEVVSRKKWVGGLLEQGWEKKLLRDLQDVLEGRPMR